MLALSRTHHVSFAVSDMDRSIAFYRDLFGFEILHDWVSEADYLGTITGFGKVRMRLAFASLPGTDVRLELIQYLDPLGSRHEITPSEPGAGHLCFDVPDIHVAYRELVERGVRARSEPVEIVSAANRGAWGVYVLDPDGIAIELRQPPPPATPSGAGRA